MLAGFLYPMLVINQTSRTVELHHTAERQKSFLQNLEGLRFLYGNQFPTEMKALDRECKQAITSHSASWLSLGMKATAAELITGLKNFLLDDMFSIHYGQLPTAEEFEINITAAKKKGLIKTIRDQIDLLLKLLVQRRQIIAKISAIDQRSKGKNDPRTLLSVEFLKHLHSLLPSDFLMIQELHNLIQVPRYLKALEIRMERAEHSPAKDTKKAHQVDTITNHLKSHSETFDNSADCLRCLSEYTEMLEEYRVSVFAPELGTLFPVSEKRLKIKWLEVENLCHRVE